MKNILKRSISLALNTIAKVSPEFRCMNDFRHAHGKFPNLIHPKTFNEKLRKKITFDRNPKLTLFADKYLVRNFVEDRCGKEILSNIYKVTSDTRHIALSSLPKQFVMKPNHLSGAVKIVQNADEENTPDLRNIAFAWLERNYYDYQQEWAYKNIKPLIIFEELLQFKNDIPDDYKFFCFNGEPRFIQIDKSRFTKHLRNIYDMNFKLLPIKYEFDNFEDKIDPPPNLDKMIEIAQKLSLGVDFVRVDLYNINGRIVFGELTNYPGASLERFYPSSWDLKFGEYWGNKKY